MTYIPQPTNAVPVTRTRRSRWVRVGLPVAGALIAGIGIGASGGETTVAAPPPPPEKVTVTETVTEEVEVEVVPQACLDAITAAEAFAEDSADFADIMVRYPDIVVAALRAGVAQDVADINAVTADVEQIGVQVTDLTGTIEGHVAAFKAGREGCR